MSPGDESAPGVQSGGADEIPGAPALNTDRSRGVLLVSPASREVSWSRAHAALWPIVARARRHGPLPLIGTGPWLDLAAGDPRRVGAVYLAAELWALDAEMHQDTTVEASQDVAAAADWARTARDLTGLAEFQRTHSWAKRITT